MTPILRSDWWQDCADVFELVRNAPQAGKDDVARASIEFLLQRGAHEVLGQTELVALEAVTTAYALCDWLEPYTLPAARPRASRRFGNVRDLLQEYGVE